MGKEELLASRSLFENGFYRGSVTQTYFSMLSAANALLLKKGISTKTHKGTFTQLAKEYVKDGLFSKEIYDYLHDGIAIRNDSSYNYSAVFSEEIADELISHAEEFLDEVERLL